MTISLRPYESRDAAPTVALFCSSFLVFPHGTAEEFQISVDSWGTRGLANHALVAEAEDRVVGYGVVVEILSEEPGLFYVEATVDPDFRRRGIGARLLQAVETYGAELKATRLVGWVHDTYEHAAAFSKVQGYEPNGASEQTSRLHVPTAHLDGFERVEQALRHDGVDIDLLADHADDENFMRQVYRVDMDSHRDVPSSVPWKDLSYEEWLGIGVYGPGRSPQWAWVGVEGGVPIGLARLRLYAAEKAADNAYTGVLASHRGQGIARALKNRTVAWSRENGVEWIYTGNEARNVRMLAINRSLGYQFLPRAIEVEKRTLSPVS
jgi:GNAT superfamily N-acetyltransferase